MKNVKPLVLFINMVNPTRDIENLYPPLGPAYLVSYIHKYLGKGKFRFKLINNNFEKAIIKNKPDILGISCVSQNYGRAIKLAEFAKNNDISWVMIGGSHISLYPQSLDQNIDIGVIGEGEQTFLELMKSYLKMSKFSPMALSKIKGIVYHDSHGLKLTAPRELIANLDDIPFPDRSLFNIDPDKAYMFSSRGCPYRCVFCASSRFWNKVRFHSAEYVFKEITLLVEKYGVKRIDFYDDLFIANKKRVQKLRDLLIAKGLNETVQFHISGRANLINDDICTTLKDMNVKGISMGLESGSPQILEYLKGGSVTVEDNMNAVNTIKKQGMYCVASFVIGTPIDTKKTILETLSFIKRSKLDEFAVYALTPLPGTPVWDYAVEHGMMPKNPHDINWQKLDVEYKHSHNTNVHLVEKLSRDEFYNLYLLFEKERTIRNVKRAFFLLATNPSRFRYHLERYIQKIFKRVM